MENTYKDPSELHCSPQNHKYAEKDKTCYTLTELKLIANEFNKNITDEKKKITGTTKKTLTEKLLKAYEPICDKHQFCWIKQTFSDHETVNKLEKAFRPQKPRSWDENHNTWLNTYDILYVMEQYQHLHKKFAFLGVYPIDFANNNSSGRCIGDIMCNFHIKKDLIEKNKNSFAIVFNTDYSTGPGQHWITCYCNIDHSQKNKNYGIYFYDSVANEEPRQVKEFMDNVEKQIEEVFPNRKRQFEKKSNKIQKQFSNYDCGVYTIILCTQCLKGIKFDDICKRMKNDNGVNTIRDILYRPNIYKESHSR